MVETSLAITGVRGGGRQVTVGGDGDPVPIAAERAREGQSGGAVTIEDEDSRQGWVLRGSAPATRERVTVLPLPREGDVAAT